MDTKYASLPCTIPRLYATQCFRGTEVADIINRSGASSLILWPLFRKVNFLEILSLIEDSAFSRVESVIVYSEDEGGVPVQNQLPLSLRSKRVASYQELIDESGAEIDNSKPDAGCNIFTTSGTTKAPKFVLHSQRSIIRKQRILKYNGLDFVHLYDDV